MGSDASAASIKPYFIKHYYPTVSFSSVITLPPPSIRHACHVSMRLRKDMLECHSSGPGCGKSTASILHISPAGTEQMSNRILQRYYNQLPTLLSIATLTCLAEPAHAAPALLRNPSLMHLQRVFSFHGLPWRDKPVHLKMLFSLVTFPMTLLLNWLKQICNFVLVFFLFFLQECHSGAVVTCCNHAWKNSPDWEGPLKSDSEI